MYCTQADLINRFGEWELVGLTNPGGDTINTAALDQAMADAGAEIEAYLGGRYALPLNPVPKVLNRIACNLARYYLYDNAVPDTVEKTYQDSLRFLKDVAKGLVKLGIAADGSQPNAAESSAKMTSTQPVWNRTKSGGFI
ncbi:MAG: gp436 family protein [Thiomicrospira sp.]